MLSTRRTTASMATVALSLALAAATTAGLEPANAASHASASRSHHRDFVRTAARDGSLAHAALRALARHSRSAHAGAGQKFRVTSVLVDPDGARHTRMTRTYRGLPVLGGDLVVHQSKSGSWRSVSQTLGHAIKVSTAPSVGKAAAGRAALAPSRVTRSIAGAGVSRSRLVVDATGASPRLAYEVISGGTQKNGTPSRLATYVDATTGKVLRTEQQIENVGNGKTIYSGEVPLTVSRSGSGYVLRSPSNVRGGTYTNDMHNAADSLGCQLFGSGCKLGTPITSTTSTFGNGSNSNRASAGADAQYGSNETWDFYYRFFGRRGIFNTGKGTYNRVHYGKNFGNAFWNGKGMTYGDGDGKEYGPLVSLDVAGHEMSHGVTENTAGLTYSGESGGLNESTSDIFGTSVEFFANNSQDRPDYLIGERFDLTKKHPLRRMDNPNAADGKSANCWSSDVGKLNVHYSSGVGNHFWYMLSEGSGAKTINGVAYNAPICGNHPRVYGIGHVAAAKIWYRALTTYMTSNTNYHGARTASLSAAKDLYGQGSKQYPAVNAAWAAVNVT